MAETLVPYAPAAGVFGRPATVTPKDGAPVVGVVIVAGREAPPVVGTLGMSRIDPLATRWIVSVPQTLVADLPVGSTILIDLDGAGVRPRHVDRVDRHPDEFRAVIS